MIITYKVPYENCELEYRLPDLAANLKLITGLNIEYFVLEVLPFPFTGVSLQGFANTRGKYLPKIEAFSMRFPGCCGVTLLKGHRVNRSAVDKCTIESVDVVDALLDWSEINARRRHYTETLYITASHQAPQIMALKRRDYLEGHKLLNNNSQATLTYWHKNII